MAGIEPAISRLEVGRDIHFATRTSPRWGSNPQSLVPKTNALSNYATKTYSTLFIKVEKDPTEIRTRVTGVKTLCDNQLHY
jgi:hypothetical protein